jgi:hypothetical protein
LNLEKALGLRVKGSVKLPELPADVPFPHRVAISLSAPVVGPSVLLGPHQMQVDFKYSMRAPTIFRHPRSLSSAQALKSVA